MQSDDIPFSPGNEGSDASFDDTPGSEGINFPLYSNLTEANTRARLNKRKADKTDTEYMKKRRRVSVEDKNEAQPRKKRRHSAEHKNVSEDDKSPSESDTNPDISTHEFVPKKGDDGLYHCPFNRIRGPNSYPCAFKPRKLKSTVLCL